MVKNKHNHKIYLYGYSLAKKLSIHHGINKSKPDHIPNSIPDEYRQDFLQGWSDYYDDFIYRLTNKTK
jgi:hypothetical protein